MLIEGSVAEKTMLKMVLSLLLSSCISIQAQASDDEPKKPEKSNALQRALERREKAKSLRQEAETTLPRLIGELRANASNLNKMVSEVEEGASSIHDESSIVYERTVDTLLDLNQALKLKGQIERLKLQREETEDNIRKISEINTQLAEELRKKKFELAKSTEENQELREEIRRLEEQIEELRRLIAEYLGSVERSEGVIKKLEEKLAKSDRKKRQYKQQARESGAQVEQLKSQQTELQQQIEKIQGILEEKSSELQRTLLQQKEIIAANERIEDEKRGLKDELLRAKQLASTLENKKSEIERQLSSSESSKEGALKELEDLKSSLQDLEQKISGAQNELDTAGERQAALRQQLSNSEEKIRELQLQNEKFAAELRDAAQRRDREIEQLEKVRTDAELEKISSDAMIDMLREEVTSLRQENEELKREIALLKKGNEDAVIHSLRLIEDKEQDDLEASSSSDDEQDAAWLRSFHCSQPYFLYNGVCPQENWWQRMQRERLEWNKVERDIERTQQRFERMRDYPPFKPRPVLPRQDSVTVKPSSPVVLPTPTVPVQTPPIKPRSDDFDNPFQGPDFDINTSSKFWDQPNNLQNVKSELRGFGSSLYKRFFGTE